MDNQMIDQSDIARACYKVVEHIVKTSGNELGCEYDYMPAKAEELPCVSVQTLNGNPVEFGFADGSYIANYRFALYLRQQDSDTASRFDGRSILDGLAKAFLASDINLGDRYTFYSARADTLPSKIAADENYDDYQVTLTVQYKATR